VQFARLTGLPVPPEAATNADGFRVAIQDPITLQAACTAARLASVLPDSEAPEVAAEFLYRLGVPRTQFGSWGQAARVLGELAAALN
jgi:hypothetical protein